MVDFYLVLLVRRENSDPRQGISRRRGCECEGLRSDVTFNTLLGQIKFLLHFFHIGKYNWVKRILVSVELEKTRNPVGGIIPGTVGSVAGSAVGVGTGELTGSDVGDGTWSPSGSAVGAGTGSEAGSAVGGATGSVVGSTLGTAAQVFAE